MCCGHARLTGDAALARVAHFYLPGPYMSAPVALAAMPIKLMSRQLSDLSVVASGTLEACTGDGCSDCNCKRVVATDEEESTVKKSD
jgi:hypothetical protein